MLSSYLLLCPKKPEFHKKSIAAIKRDHWTPTEHHLKCEHVLRYWVCHVVAHPLLSHIYIIIIFAPLRLGQYLDYIENDSVKSFVLVSIALALLLFTFHCTV